MKSKIKQQDLLYRFYTGQSEKPKPSVEPYLYGLGFTTLEATGEMKSSFTGSGYGATLFFNNFITGFTDLAMPNITLGILAEKREDKRTLGSHNTTMLGGSARFFAKNHQDSAFYLNYRNLRRDVNVTPVSEWSWDVQGRLFLLPALAIEGNYKIGEKSLKGKPSAQYAHSGFKYGGFLRFSMLHLGGFYEEDKFQARNTNSDESKLPEVAEKKTVVFLGVSL